MRDPRAMAILRATFISSSSSVQHPPPFGGPTRTLSGDAHSGDNEEHPRTANDVERAHQRTGLLCTSPITVEDGAHG
jgi:hypothetical protein